MKLVEDSQLHYIFIFFIRYGESLIIHRSRFIGAYFRDFNLNNI